jgi:RNA polymerase sigma-70 factor, ECF subfamily
MELTRQQFEAMCLAELDGLYRVARRLARDTDRAEDLVQETCLRAFRSRDSFRLQEAGYGIRPWLLRIMHNLHITRSAREKRQPAPLQADTPEPAAPGGALPLPPALVSADDGQPWVGDLAGLRLGMSAINADVMDQRLVRELNKLSEEYQVVLLLWAVEELSYKEIAAVLDVPIGTVMSRLHRARQRLARDLADFVEREGVLRAPAREQQEMQDTHHTRVPHETPETQEVATGSGE